jgi:hypothetical protein
MGQTASTRHDVRFVRAWGTLEAMSTDQARLQALEMLLGSPEYIQAAKQAGIYADFTCMGCCKTSRATLYLAKTLCGCTSAFTGKTTNAAAIVCPSSSHDGSDFWGPL